MKLSVLTPAFNEELNLPALHARLVSSLDPLGVDWEWIVVDDHSRDDTFGALRALALRDPRVRGIRLARNSGSHVAIACALHYAAGDAAVMLAADLQDPPETLAAMMRRWRDGAQVVWAMRRERPGDRAHAGFAAVYYWIMRHLVGMREMPARGADFFWIDRQVIEAFRACSVRNVSVLALITWLGFRQEYIEYDKQPRQAGRSGWTLGRKITLVLDSVTAFSDLPLRALAVAGAVMLLLALPAAVAGLVAAARAAWLLAALALAVGGSQLLGMGILGLYLWRALDEARGRPAYLVEAVVPPASAGVSA